MSKLLIDEPPLQVLPSLAKAIGINEAIVLQQIHYWVGKKKHFYDGRYWTYNTYKEWQEQFEFLTERGIRSVITKLEKLSLVKSDHYNSNKFDRTKWYTINYDILDSYLLIHASLNDTSEPSVNDTSLKTETTKTNIYIGEGKNVSISEDEHTRLKDRFGNDLVERCADKLSSYLLTSPKKARQYKSHYGAILSWVIKSVLESNPPRVLTKAQMLECEKKYSPIRSRYNYDNGSEKFRLK